MLILLAFIIIFHLTSLTFLLIATIDSAWWVGDDFKTDLWLHCVNQTNCTTIDSRFPEHEAITAMRCCMSLATVGCFLGLIVFVGQLFRLKNGERFIWTAGIQLMSSLLVMVAASIYTDRHEMLHNPELYNFDISKGSFGYSFILAWIAFAFTLISGLMYLILRKRK